MNKRNKKRDTDNVIKLENFVKLDQESSNVASSEKVSTCDENSEDSGNFFCSPIYSMKDHGADAAYHYDLEQKITGITVFSVSTLAMVMMKVFQMMRDIEVNKWIWPTKCEKVDEDGLSWTRNTVANQGELKSKCISVSNFTILHFLKLIGSGNSGHAYLAYCTNSKMICTVKRFKRKEPEETHSKEKLSEEEEQAKRIEEFEDLVKPELSLWHNIHGEDSAKMISCGDERMLVMKFVYCPFQHKPSDNNIIRDVNEEIKRWADCGYQHNELVWRHVGYMLVKEEKNKWKKVIRFIDLGNVERIKRGQKNKAMQEMRISLGISDVLAPSSTTSSNKKRSRSGSSNDTRPSKHKRMG